MVMKNFLILCLLMLFVPFTVLSVQAEESVQVSELQLITPHNIDFSKCVKTYDFPVEKLFYLAILAINANHFEIEELQSKMGYILFRAVNKNFLMSVVKIDSERSMLKITPADNVYFFPYGVVYNIFRYIDLNSNEQLQELNLAN